MLIVQDKLVSDEVAEEQFICNLAKCKGACCWEGDFGAPLEDAELDILNRIYPAVRPFLSDEGTTKIDKEGSYEYFDDMPGFGTKLLPDGRCVFLTFADGGIAQCGIEQAWRSGATDFQKPISCHLYPIRISHNENQGFESLNYDVWDICSAACALGKEHQMPVYKFLKDALIRKYGEDFYEELDATAAFLKSKK